MYISYDYQNFTNFLKLCATHCGQMINLSSLGRDIGVSHSTVSNWISILETYFVIHRVYP
ncbi:MAG: DUF4143 domain-containing protein [Leadbetterella sp.]